MVQRLLSLWTYPVDQENRAAQSLDYTAESIVRMEDVDWCYCPFDMYDVLHQGLTLNEPFFKDEDWIE